MTLGEAQAELQAWRQALARLRTAQSYSWTHGGTSYTLTRADIGECRRTIDYYQSIVNELTAAQEGSGAPDFVTANLNH